MTSYLFAAYGYASSTVSAAYSWATTKKELTEEEKAVQKLSEAKGALVEHLALEAPLLFKTDRDRQIANVLRVLNLFEAMGVHINPDLKTNFNKAWADYQALVPSSGDTHADLSKATQEARDANLKDPVLNARVMVFSEKLNEENLAKGGETGSYANFIESREALRVALQYAFPEETITTSNLQTFLTPYQDASGGFDLYEFRNRLIRTPEGARMAPLARDKVQDFITAQQKDVDEFSAWDQTVPMSTRVSYQEARIKQSQGGKDVLLWERRAERLQARVEKIEEVVSGFQVLQADYKARVTQAREELERRLLEIDPALVDASKVKTAFQKIKGLTSTPAARELSAMKSRYEALKKEEEKQFDTSATNINDLMRSAGAFLPEKNEAGDKVREEFEDLRTAFKAQHTDILQREMTAGRIMPADIILGEDKKDYIRPPLPVAAVAANPWDVIAPPVAGGVPVVPAPVAPLSPLEQFKADVAKLKAKPELTVLDRQFAGGTLSDLYQDIDQAAEAGKEMIVVPLIMNGQPALLLYNVREKKRDFYFQEAQLRELAPIVKVVNVLDHIQPIFAGGDKAGLYKKKDHPDAMQNQIEALLR